MTNVSALHSATPPAVCFDLQSFAAEVLAAVATVGTGETERFGHRKVFVSAAHASLASAGHDVGSPSVLKDRLVLAHSAGLLELARADFVPAMPRDAVAASEIRCAISEFHFVVDRSARDPWQVQAA